VRIAIEALGIDRPGGGRIATLNLLRPLLAIDSQHEYVIYLSTPEPSLDGLNPRAHQRIVPVRNRFLARLALQAVLPIACRQQQFDLVHFVKNQVVAGTGTRTIATVYDLTTLRHPEVYPPVDVWYWRNVLPRQYRKLNALIAISESTASDLVSFFQVPRDRIRVIHCGYDPAYRPPPPQEIEMVLRRHALHGMEYFIHVGNLSLKKNLAMLVDAFVDFRRRTGFAGKLVLVGGDYPKGRDEDFYRLLSGAEVQGAVVLTGHVPQRDLIGLYGGALALVFPSLHEGFGLVALEAMACGTPVITHAAGAVREVVGTAGIVIDAATDASAWSRALERVAGDPSLRATMREAGLDRATAFTAEQSARHTLHLYEQIASSGRS
jgi:glycosyltransferase involved in cell wall biosynthesis